MSLNTTTSFRERARSEADDVLEILGRWDQKMQGHQTQKRTNARVPFRAPVRLYHRKGEARDDTGTSTLTVWARNISVGGIGFIFKGHIASKRVVICLDPEAGQTKWFHAEIVRCRPVHNNFWEYGARFTGRATADDATAADAGPDA